MRTWFRRIASFALVASGLSMLPASPALAGGGCHGSATRGDARGKDAVTIEMVDACFTPTTLRADAGAEITFTNRDGMTHNLSGPGWGSFDELLPGDRVTMSFGQPGIYPYGCTFHPGMAGAIVVGDGLAAGNGGYVSVLPEPVVVAPGATARSSDGWVGPAAIGLLIGGAAGIGLARVRRMSAGA